MMDNYARPLIDKKYITVFAIAVFFSWELHELAHWAVGEYLGYKMGMGLNNTYPLSGKYLKDSDYQIISSAGPIFTISEAILVFILMIQKRRLLLYPFLFTCFYMRFFAAAISFHNPNDEARISSAIGIGKFTLPLIVALILFALVYKISKTYKFDTKFNLANLGLTILFPSIIILTGIYFKIQLL